jgi:hypothetical protein
LICRYCGQLKGVEEYDARLWDLHGRRKDEKQTYDGLVFTSDWLQENIVDEDDERVLDQVMSKDMASRGLCPECGRPNLSGKTEEDFYTEEEARDMHDMWAEQAAERRMGC